MQNNISKVVEEMDIELAGDKNQEKEIAKAVNDEADRQIYARRRSQDIERRFKGDLGKNQTIEEKYKAKSMARCETIVSTTVTRLVISISINRLFEPTYRMYEPLISI